MSLRRTFRVFLTDAFAIGGGAGLVQRRAPARSAGNGGRFAASDAPRTGVVRELGAGESGQKITILGKNIRVEFSDPPHGRREDIVADLGFMVQLINRTTWPSEYSRAYRLMEKIVFFHDRVTVNGNVMSRSCCDEDDRIFYWEIDEEFLRNRDADVHAHTLFHDCWHVVQYQRDGGFAYEEHVRVAREVEAISHQIEVAKLLGCDEREIKFLRDFRGDQGKVLARLEEGVHERRPAAGSMG